MDNTPLLSPLRAGTKRKGSNGAKLLRKYGADAIRAAKRESGIIPGAHGAPEFYYSPKRKATSAPRLVKKGA
jgi:hypothetical protein